MYAIRSYYEPANNWIKGKKKITYDVVIMGFNNGTGKNKSLFGSIVITSYSIHYTKLYDIYESCLPYIKTGNPIVLKGKRDTYRDVVTIQCIYVRGITNVITSYSIHYTKLYELLKRRALAYKALHCRRNQKLTLLFAMHKSPANRIAQI